MKAKEKLAAALTAAKAPQRMIDDALQGRYDDFESDSATPIIDLVNACNEAGLPDLALRAMDGEFDGE